MSASSDSITWQSWSQKWGYWTIWFTKADLPPEPSEVRLAAERHIENVQNGGVAPVAANARVDTQVFSTVTGINSVA